jgi:hypothetical protein
MRYAPIKARNASKVSYIVREGAIMGEVQEVRLMPVSNDACGVAVEFPILFTIVCRIPKQKEGAEAAAWKQAHGFTEQIFTLLKSKLK